MRLAFANLWCVNPRVLEATRRLGMLDADVLAFCEVPPAQIDGIRSTLPGLPHCFSAATNGMGSLVLFSKAPFAATEVCADGHCADRPFVRAVIASRVPIAVILAHTTAPFTPACRGRRDRQIEAIADAALATHEPVALLGDFNAGNRSQPILSLLAKTGLCDTRRGSRSHATWPSFAPWLPLDHILLADALGAFAVSTHPTFLSDHRAIAVELMQPPD